MNELKPFEERLRILTNEIDLAVQWKRHALLLAVYTSEYVRMDVEDALENFLIEHKQRVQSIELESRAGLDVIRALHESASADTVFFVSGLVHQPVEQINIFRRLGSHKDIIINGAIRMVLWLTPDEIARMAALTPDLWELRQRVIEFADAPKPEQILQTAIETTWLGTGEFNGRVDDTEDKIQLRETFLTELPDATESTAARAKLLLSLGVLHWRKGDHAKADSLLQDALKAAIRMEDSWFEAECFNAIALVKSGMNKNDEAIEAYKQAIRLAPGQIFVWNNLGNLCMKINRNDEAMHAFQKALDHNGKDPVAWCGLGNVYYRIGYIDDAINAFRKAIEHAPLLAHPWVGLGDAYASVGRDVDAIAAYQKAVEANRQYVTPWLRLADIYCKQNRNRDAVKAYQRALDIDPRNSGVLNELGLAHLKTQNYEEAITAFKRCIEVDRGCAWAYSNISLAFAELGQYQQAILYCKKSLELFANDDDKAVSWNRLANHYRAINDYNNAIEAYQKADRLNGRGIEAGETPASDSSEPDQSYEAESQPEVESAAPVANQPKPKAHADLTAPVWFFTETSTSEVEADEKGKEQPMANQEALLLPAADSDIPFHDETTEPVNPMVWNEKGNIHFHNGAYEDAIRAYNKAIEMDRSFGWAYSNLALTYLTLGKLAEAILLYERSITLLQSNAEKAAAWNSLGNIHRAMNDYQKAQQAYRQADEIDPENAGLRNGMELAQAVSNSTSASVWIELGNLFYKAGSYNSAADAYAKAVQMDPQSGAALSNLALAQVFAGKYRDAADLYRKSLDLFTDNKDKAAVWNRLGNVYRKLNDYDNAKAAYENAMKLSNEKASLLTRTRLSLLGNVHAG